MMIPAWKFGQPCHHTLHQFYAVIGSILLLLAMPLSAQVYKWVDENGKTHYSDKPRDEKSETVQLRKSRKADAELNEQLKKQMRLLQVMEEERQDAKQEKAVKVEEMRVHKSKCEKARRQLQQMKEASFLYKESSDPDNPVIYSDEERSKITRNAEKAVQDGCK